MRHPYFLDQFLAIDHELARLRDPRGSHPCGIRYWADAVRSEWVTHYVGNQLSLLHSQDQNNDDAERSRERNFVYFHGIYEYGAIAIARLVTVNLQTRDVDRIDPFWVTGAVLNLVEECNRRIEKANAAVDNGEDMLIICL